MIKSDLNNYNQLIVFSSQNSNLFGLSSIELSKIILKIHQILMEISSEYNPIIINNSYEAHTLNTILEKSKISSSQVSQPSEVRIHLTTENSAVIDSEIFINKDLILLAVTSRGSFNYYINAIFATFLIEIGYPVKSLVDVPRLVTNGYRLFEESRIHMVDLEVYEKYLKDLV